MVKRVFALVLCALLCAACFCTACAEDDLESVWVLCQPDSYVNIRMNPKRNSMVVARADCGNEYWTDGKEKNGFLHVYGTFEDGEGWIKNGYIVWNEPERVFETWRVVSNGRVAVRSTIGGKRTRWMRNGDEIRVYYVAEQAVTNKGFINADYIEPTGGQDGTAED